MKPRSHISFCVITDGRRPNRTLVAVRSVVLACQEAQVCFELLVVGATTPIRTVDCKQLVFVEVSDTDILRHLGALRNIAAENARYPILVFADDDIVFQTSWGTQFLSYDRSYSWDVLGNRILSPDGSRHWDRATLCPHRLVPYDHPEDDLNLYQSGGFVALRREVAERVRWNDKIPFYAERQGGENEDVEFSRRLVAEGYRLSFDQNNVVWHFDPNYHQSGDHVVRGRPPRPYCKEFAELLCSLQPAVDQLQIPVATPAAI